MRRTSAVGVVAMPQHKFPWETEQQPNDRMERDLRVRKGGNGWGNVSIGSYAPAAGDEVIATDGGRGKVVSVGASTFTIHWTDVDFSVVYPSGWAKVRKALPWE